MKELNKNTVGLILGSFFALWHLLWGLLVATGLAQTFLDWIYWLHFMNDPFRIEAFDITRSVTLIIVTFVVGYIFGWVFVWLWEMMRTKRK